MYNTEQRLTYIFQDLLGLCYILLESYPSYLLSCHTDDIRQMRNALGIKKRKNNFINRKSISTALLGKIEYEIPTAAAAEDTISDFIRVLFIDANKSHSA